MANEFNPQTEDPIPGITAQKFQNPTPQTTPKPSGGGAAPDQSSYINPQAYQNAIAEVQKKLETNNKLVAAKKAIFKHMYDQPLTADEQNALTPSLKIGMMSGDRNMIDMSIQAINDQIKGYDASIDNNLSNYVTAMNSMVSLRSNISDQVASMVQNGVDPNTIAGLIGGATGGMISPAEYGFTSGAAAVNAVDGSQGGECGAFVNQYLGNKVFGDTIQQKESMINSYTPTSGAVAVIPTTGATAGEGHVAIVESVNPDGTLNVVESNWNLDGKVDHRTISPSAVAGYYTDPSKQTWSYPGGGTGSSNAQDWAQNIVSGQATLSQVPSNIRNQVSNLLSQQNYVPPAELTRRRTIASQYPKIIKSTDSGWFGTGIAAKTTNTYEVIDPESGQKENFDNLEDATAEQNKLNEKAGLSSSTSDTTGQDVVNDGTQDYTLQDDGTYLGDDGSTYQMNDDGTLTLTQ